MGWFNPFEGAGTDKNAIKVLGPTTTQITDGSTVNPVDIMVLTKKQPSDWETNYTDYYVYDSVNDTYVHVSGAAAPQWETGKYYSKQSIEAKGNDTTFYGDQEFIFDGMQWHKFGDIAGVVTNVNYDSNTRKLKQVINGQASEILTVDNTPTNDSNNPVSSDGVYEAIKDYAGKKVAGVVFTKRDGTTVTAGAGAEQFNNYGTNQNTDSNVNIPSGQSSHAEGTGTTASGTYSHAEGNTTIASGSSSHAEGFGTNASGNNSHTEGAGTKASSGNQHVEGKFNTEDSSDKYAHIIGNGTANNSRSNAYCIDWYGKIYQPSDPNGNANGVYLSDKLDADIIDPISEQEYEEILVKDKPIYFIYED